MIESNNALLTCVNKEQLPPGYMECIGICPSLHTTYPAFLSAYLELNNWVSSSLAANTSFHHFWERCSLPILAPQWNNSLWNWSFCSLGLFPKKLCHKCFRYIHMLVTSLLSYHLTSLLWTIECMPNATASSNLQITYANTMY